MKHIFANMKKYWYFIIAIFLLLIVQAYCDLALPDYTSNIIDVGITNSGIEHAMPEYMTSEGYASIAMFLTEDELADLSDAYSFNAKTNRFELKDNSESNWDKVDDEFGKVAAITHMMSTMQSGEGSQKREMSEEEIAQMQAFQALMEKVNTPGYEATDEEKMAIAQYFAGMRSAMEDSLSALGDNMVKSMGKAFAKAQYEACNVDLKKMQSDYMWRTGAKMLTMAFIMAVLAIIVGFMASKVGAGVGRDLRGKVFKKVMGFSNAGIDKFSTASLITRSTNDVQQVQIVTVIMLRMVLYAPILAIGGIINIRRYNSGMAWVIIVAVAAVLSLIAILMSIALPKFKIMQTLVDKVNLVAREILTGIPVVRAFGREKKEEERFDDANKELTGVMLFTNRVMSTMMPIMMLIMNGVSVLIIWVASHRIDDGRLEVGSMTAFITYAFLIIMSFLMLSMISIMLPRAGVAADRIHELLTTENVITEKEDAIEEFNGDATISFENVSFMYPNGEENAIEGIDFVSKPGQTTAIIGSTGCGKSTLVKLIPRFYDCTEGNILLGGKNIKDYKLKTLRDQIGFVPQKGILFTGDISSNIAFGAPGADEETIKEAARIAQAAEFIEEKPEKYESAIAQGGTNVSGGQKQRLAIARAIARNPKVYIFDDSFSALDFKTDTALRKALSDRTKDATVIIVAQRVSTILNADQIIVLEEGKMIGKGTHRELVASCETYKQIAQSQLSEKEFNDSITAIAGNGKEEC